MQIQNSKHAEPLSKLLNAYQAGPILLSALVTYVDGAERRVESRLRMELAAEMADTVCEGLHPPPATGVKCLRCYEAEIGVVEPSEEV